MNRGTLALDLLEQQLFVNFSDGVTKQNATDQESEDDDDNYIAVHLAETDKKSFNKFILDTFSEIQHFYKYSLIVDNE